MQYRSLGKLGKNVSEIGFGSASISGEGGGYGFGSMSEQDALTLIYKVREAGINLLDSAPIYGFGLAEKRIGKTIDPEKRDDVFIISKGGFDWDQEKRTRIDNSPSTLLRMLHQSLNNLKTEYIDLYFVHWPDPNVDIRRTMEILSRAKEQEKIRAIGLSNFSVDQIQLAMEIDRVDVIQHPFNVFQRDILREVVPFVEDNNMGLLTYGTFDQGILTGRATLDREFDSTDHRKRNSWWKKSKIHQKSEALDEILPYIEERGISAVELALNFVLKHDFVSSSLCGVRNEEQLNQTLAAAQKEISEDVFEEVLTIADDYLEDF